jgi:hypothetical protein
LHVCRYDTNQSGALEPAQLKEFLTELNSGVPPEDEEVAAVLGHADASKEVGGG